ncbi:MAG: FAD-binding oxidoreductase [Woeseiaceae bacterium]
MSTATLLDQLQEIVGDHGWTTDEADLEPHLTERRGMVRGKTLVMVSPSSTREVSAIVSACAAHNVAVVPQGGNTGLCGGAIPDASGEQVLLSLARMNSIRSIDASDNSMVVDAGCILADIQQAAHDAGRYFPLSLAAEGSCQIGGNLATNAGGLNVLRYGTARQQVLGLEVVLADGTVWDGLRTVCKDNAGYDIKQLFIGSEGTLGIITAAALRLWPQPGETTTILAAIEQPAQAIALLSCLREVVGDNVQAFELISDRCFRFVNRHLPDSRLPFEGEGELMRLIEDGVVADVVVAKSAHEAQVLWRMRHAIPDAQRSEGASLKHDISVPTSRIAEFVDQGARLVASLTPGGRLVAFGHVGDGNLHFNVSQPPGGDAEQFRQAGSALTRALYDLADSMGGSFSAEHGIGVTKRNWLEHYKGGAEIELMRTLKAALDPHNTLNPGKVI